MGAFNILKIENSIQRNLFYKDIFDDLDVFDQMLAEGVIDQNDNVIGAEQELCIVGKDFCPKPKALAILDDLKMREYTNELALYNLEINLDPVLLEGGCFSGIEKSLLQLIEDGRTVARKHDADIFITGILPTITKEFLHLNYMTPIERYFTLNDALLNLRGKKFEIYLQGVDDLHLKLNSILFEACNTSMQLHLQINPNEFAHYYNWAQMISGPVLSCCVNSPLLFSKELWAETRIAVFKQSLDTRNHLNHYRERLPRVYFGESWLNGSPSELWKNEVVRFPLIFRGEGGGNSMSEFSNGIMPNLKSVRLHNGTTYTWNRMCYGVDNNASHIRIECRYLPAGPTVVDEIANMVFWVGLMKAAKFQENNFWKNLDFKATKANFFRAARTGLDTEFDIFGREINADELILDILLPLARRGLTESNVNESDADYYLSIIEKRVLNRQTGAQWQTSNFRKLTEKFKPSLASKVIVGESLNFQMENIPISEWQNLTNEKLSLFFESNFKTLTAKDIMSHHIHSIDENTSILLAIKLMQWKNIHHVLVENQEAEFKGLLNLDDILELKDEMTSITDHLTAEYFSIHPNTLLSEIQDLFASSNKTSAIVFENKKAVGIITNKDL